MSALRELLTALTPPTGESRLDIVLILLVAACVAGALSLTGIPGGCL